MTEIKNNAIKDSIEYQNLCPIIDPIMTIDASMYMINHEFFHEMDDDLKQHFQRIQRSIDKIYTHVKTNQTLKKIPTNHLLNIS